MTKTVNGNQPRTIFLQFRYKTTFYSKIYTVSVVVSEALGSVALDAAAAAALALANPTPPPHPCRATCVVSSVRCWHETRKAARVQSDGCWHGTLINMTWRSRILMIRTGMREIIELIRKHPKIRRILRCESPYFHHCCHVQASTLLQRLDLPVLLYVLIAVYVYLYHILFLLCFDSQWTPRIGTKFK